MSKNRTILDTRISTQIARKSILALIKGLEVPKEDYEILMMSTMESLKEMKKGTSRDVPE